MPSLGRGLAGIFSSAFPVLDEIQNGTNAACSAFAAGDLVNTDANIVDLRDNWRTTGFYTRDQLNKIIVFVADINGRAFDAIRSADEQLQLDEHRTLLNDAEAGMSDNSLSANPYTEAVHDATVQGINIIEAQGLKRWILGVLRAARNVEFAVKVVGCARPALLFGALQALNSVADSLVKFVKTIVAVVAKVGELVLKIPDLLSSVVSFLKILPWFVLAFGGYYAGVKTGLIPTKFDPMRLRERETFKPWRRK